MLRGVVAAVLLALACALPLAAFAGAPVRRVSVSTAGVEADLYSSDVSISGDGRFVAFQSGATTLVKHDTNGFTDIFVRDRKAGTTRRVSLATNGSQANAHSSTAEISGNGRFVVFTSDATNLVPGDTNNRTDIFIRDLKTKTTRRVSVNSAEEQADEYNYSPSVSADGRFVVWESYSENLGGPDPGGFQQVYIRDRTKGITRRISIGIGKAAPDSDSSVCGGYAPAISADGTYVAFASSATNLVPNDTKGKQDVFVRNWRTGVTRRVSVSSAGAEADQGGSSYCSISGGGKLVAFESDSTNLVKNDKNTETDVFVRNWKTKKTTRVNVTSSGKESTDWGGYSGISANGRFVIFQGPDQNLAPKDKNKKDDVYVHDRWTKETRRVSFGKGMQPNGNGYAWISANGKFVVFESDLKLVKNDGNNVSDVYVRGPLHW